MAVRQTVHEGCDRAGYYEQGRLRARLRRPEVPGQDRLPGPGRATATCPSAAGWPASAAARTSAASASAARCRASPTSSCRSWTSRRAAGCDRRDQGYSKWIGPLRRTMHRHAQQGTEVAARGPRLTTGYQPRMTASASARAADEGATSMATRHWKSNCAKAATRSRQGQAGRDALGSDHPDRRQPRHLHQDRLRRTGRSPSATAPRRSSAATASS